MNDTKWIVYFLCEGCGINTKTGSVFTAEFKELCCRGFTNFENPLQDGTPCSALDTFLCIWSECQLPPDSKNASYKSIACCQCLTGKKGASAPAQMEIK